MASRRSRWLVPGTAAILLLVASIPASAGEPEARWGWATVRHPGVDYDPAPKDQGNSLGSNNHVVSNAPGDYFVEMEEIGGIGGVVHVTPLGNTTNICEIVEWNAFGPDVGIDVDCFTLAGALAETRFTVSYMASDGATGKLAHAWIDDAITPMAPANWSYNSTGGTNTVSRTDTGVYQVTLPGLGSMRGHVQVTSFETSFSTTAGGLRTDVLPAVCSVGGWGPSSGDMVATVLCRDSNGFPTNTRFTLTFMQGLGLKGQGGHRVAYLLAARPNAPSYTPDADYRFSSNGQASNVTHDALGRYTATLPGMPKGGTAQVTPYGSAAKRCIVGSIRTSAAPQNVKVRCFDYEGDPVNAKFTLAYEK